MARLTSNPLLTLHCKNKWNNNTQITNGVLGLWQLGLCLPSSLPVSWPWQVIWDSVVLPRFSELCLCSCFFFFAAKNVPFFGWQIPYLSFYGKSVMAFTNKLYKILLHHVICYVIFWLGYFGNFYPEDTLILGALLCTIISFEFHFDGA